MINPVNNNNPSFKSAPWYANVITGMTKADALAPIIALETTVTGGRTIQAHKRGGKDESRERLIEETTGAIVWLFGVQALNYVGDKILGKLYGGNFDVGTDHVLRTPFKNFLMKNSGKKFAKKPSLVALVKGVKVLTSIVLADAFIGLVVPPINQSLTRFLTNKRELEAEELQAEKAAENKTDEKQSDVAFKGAALGGINAFTNFIENTNVGKLLSVDAGLVSGRVYSARNNDERREIAIRDLGSIYFYMWAQGHVCKVLNKLESGHWGRLNPNTAHILDRHLDRILQEHDNVMPVEEFERLVLGDSSKVELPEGIKFETGKVSALSKLFKGRKEPLQVAKVSDLEGLFEPEIMDRIREMSKLQPLRQGEAVVTKQQIIDAMNVAEINDPDLLNNVFSEFTGGKGKVIDKTPKGKTIRSKTEYVGGAYNDEFRYVSNSRLYKLKDEMEVYIKDICKRAKDGKITKDILEGAKNRNTVLSGVNFIAGFLFAASFLSTFIPKIQYWVTRKKAGIDAFPGTYDYEHARAATDAANDK